MATKLRSVFGCSSVKVIGEVHLLSKYRLRSADPGYIRVIQIVTILQVYPGELTLLGFYGVSLGSRNQAGLKLSEPLERARRDRPIYTEWILRGSCRPLLKWMQGDRHRRIVPIHHQVTLRDQLSIRRRHRIQEPDLLRV